MMKMMGTSAMKENAERGKRRLPFSHIMGSPVEWENRIDFSEIYSLIAFCSSYLLLLSKFSSLLPLHTMIHPSTLCPPNHTFSNAIRLVKNREAAQLFRQRQRAYISDLETKVNGLSTENAENKSRVDLLRSENKLIKEQLVYLRNFISQAVSFSLPTSNSSSNNNNSNPSNSLPTTLGGFPFPPPPNVMASLMNMMNNNNINNPSNNNNNIPFPDPNTLLSLIANSSNGLSSPPSNLANGDNNNNNNSTPPITETDTSTTNTTDNKSN